MAIERSSALPERLRIGNPQHPYLGLHRRIPATLSSLTTAELVPYAPLALPSCGWNGFIGVARSVLIAVHTPATELRAQRSELSMSWPTALYLWKAEGLGNQALLLNPSAEHELDRKEYYYLSILVCLYALTLPPGDTYIFVASAFTLLVLGLYITETRS